MRRTRRTAWIASARRNGGIASKPSWRRREVSDAPSTVKENLPPDWEFVRLVHKQPHKLALSFRYFFAQKPTATPPGAATIAIQPASPGSLSGGNISTAPLLRAFLNAALMSFTST